MREGRLPGQHSRHHSHRTLTALCAPPPDAAAHSRSADIVISRDMIRHTGTAMPRLVMGAGGSVASNTRAVDTLQGAAPGHMHS